MPVAEFLKLTGHQVEHALEITLGRTAAVAVASAHQFQFKVQVSHSSVWVWAGQRRHALLAGLDGYDPATEFESLGGKLIDLAPTEWKGLAQAA